MICDFCNAQIPDESVACPQCQASLKDNCPSCGKLMRVFEAKCPSCGVLRREAIPGKPEPLHGGVLLFVFEFYGILCGALTLISSMHLRTEGATWLHHLMIFFVGGFGVALCFWLATILELAREMVRWTRRRTYG